MKRQIGVTLGGMLIFMLLLSLVVYTASRIVPAYTDDWLIGRALDNLVAQPGLQSSSDESIRAQFAKQMNFNNITVAKRADLLIERIPGGVRLSASFSTKRPFLGPVSLCLDFQAEASSGNAAGK